MLGQMLGVFPVPSGTKVFGGAAWLAGVVINNGCGRMLLVAMQLGQLSLARISHSRRAGGCCMSIEVAHGRYVGYALVQGHLLGVPP